MGHDRWREQLRMTSSDTVALAALLAGGLPSDGLQHAGSAVLAHAGEPTLEVIVTNLVAELRDRDWNGDEELAVDLEQRRAGQPSALTPIGVSLEDLAEVLDESPGHESFLDLASGAVWPAALFEVDQGPEDFDPDDSQRWLLVRGEGSHEAYRDMERFIATVSDPRLAARLRDAINGPGAFGRFRSAIDDESAELTRWHRFSDDSSLGRGVSPVTWCRSQRPSRG
ncbi:MAG: UPF0158 family protein [Acidimicrobiia bacterium]